MAEIHLDQASGLPFIDDDGTGTPRLLSLLPNTKPMALPDFKTYLKPIPQSEWMELDMLSTFQPPILDQNGFGSCTGHGAATAFSLAWRAQGEDALPFSACYVYGKINGGRDAGANIGDTIDTLQRNGICLESTVPEGMIFERKFPAKADQEAAQYKLIEAYKTNDPADVFTAAHCGDPMNLSVMVGRSFNNLNSEGVAGIDRGPGNHAICCGGLKRLAKGWGLLCQNSWGKRWGNDGRFIITEAHIQSQGYFEAVVYRVVSPGPNAPKPPG